MFQKSSKKCVFVFSLCFNLLLIKFIVSEISALGVAAISEKQRLEIQRLKSELAEALENDNENVAAKGVIVQPSWTQDADKSAKTESAKVEINEQNRKEAEALRAEIAKAVSGDKYVTAGAAKSQDIKELVASFVGKEKSKEALLAVQGKQSEPTRLEDEYVGSGSVDNEDQDGNPKAPNVIIANIGDESEIDIRKLQRLEVSKRRTREVLILKYIEEDFSFNFGAEVNEWKHIVHAGHEYFIGRRVTDLLIVRKETTAYERALLVDVGQVINFMETYTYWNSEQQQQEGVILISTGDRVLWYRANPKTKQIELYWDWMVGSVISGLSHFTLDSKDYLTISSNQSFLAGHNALNIYQYKLELKELWIAQRLQLQYPCKEVTVLNSGRDIILAIPQNNTAAIYTFNPHEAAYSHIHFELKRAVAAEGILTIAGFQMGGRSYLALTGYQPQILLYQHGDFISKTLLGNNFGLVELFFPIPVRTYRDDLILLVQHRVDFSTHTLTVVETLIWDGDAFETSIPVPCHLGEHIVHGVGCMLDLQRDEGLKGAALLKTGDDVSLIVPRHKAESGLFRFHTELLAKNSELLDLQEIFGFLKDWVKEQDDLTAQAEFFLQIPNEEIINYKPDLTDLETLKTPEFVFHGEAGEVHVNDYKWTPEDSNINLEWLIQNIENLERSLNSGRQRRNLDDVLHNELHFDEVIVDELELENLNGQQFFIKNGELNFEGLVNFAELEVLEKSMNSRKRQVNDEDFVLEGDLEFDQINGIDWSDIKQNLVFKTQTQNLEELKVIKEVFVESDLNIKTLNSLNFPDDFMLSSGPAVSIVSAEKHFSNTLSVNSIDTNGSINGKNPVDAITLTDAQEWKGMPTFKHLEVSEVFELQGLVHGRYNDSYPKNPSLKNTNIINATCHFNELIVKGPLVLKGETNDQPLGRLVKDILLKSKDPNQEIMIPSLKSFDSVTFPIDFRLKNNTINQIPIKDFVTVHTTQTLNITSLKGDIYFYNLTLNGSYDGVKIEDVLKEVILLENPVDLSKTELIFPRELKANSILIVDTLNELSIKENLQTLKEDLNVESAEFEHLQTQQADFSQDILGQGKLNNVELHSLLNERSWHEPPIRGNIFLNELILEEGLQSDELHGIRSEFLLEFLNQIDELPDMVLNGQIQVDHITVTGDVQLHKLNGLLFDEDIQLTTVKLNRPNFLSTTLGFINRLNIKGQLNVVGDFRGNYLPDTIDEIVVRSTNSCININAPKIFLKPVEVLQNTQVKGLNGVPFENMAWKSKDNNFKGSVHLNGNLVVRDINLQGNVNNLNWQNIENRLYFDEILNNFVLKDTVEFKTSLFLDDLTVMGDLNNVPNLSDFFKNIIYKNQSCLLNGVNTFTGRVSLDSGAYIKYLNGEDLTYLFSNLVFINGSQQPIELQAPVTFEDFLRADEIQIQKSLNLEYLSRCQVREWLNNSLRVDQDQNITDLLQFVGGSIDGNSLSVHSINDKDLSRIITLNTPQTFNETVKFSDVVLNGFIVSKGRVNNLDLAKEFNNTLMTSGQQHISTPLTIQTIVVLQDLVVRGLVNGNKDFQDVATLQGNLVFKSPLYFQSIYSPQVITKDSVTGIDFNKWFQSAVKKQYPVTQYITGNWSSKYFTIKTEPKDFQYGLNGLEPWQYYSYIRLARSDSKETHEDEEICLLIKQIWQDIAKKPVYIKYIEESFNMDLRQHIENTNETLNKIFYLKSDQEYFLLINLKCTSFLYKWSSQENDFIYENSFESGPIDAVEVIPRFNNKAKLEFITNFVTTEEGKCSLKATKKWKLENNSIVLDTEVAEAWDLLLKTQGNNTSLWTLQNETINKLDLNYEIKQKWQLPVEKNKNRYRFVPFREEQEILLTNGDHLALLSNYRENKSQKSSYSQEPKFFQTSYFENLNGRNSESLLKPNASLTHSFAFADIKQVIKRILIDLGQRLNQQINITQLSIPESDLLDEHLVPDFLATIEELQKQNIYPAEIFNTSLDNITLPEYRAQILAARVMQISWPVVMEIEEIHSYLRANEKHDHPLCSSITQSLVFLIKDVLVLANQHNNNKDTDQTLKLSSVIERIRIFHKELEKFIEALENQKDIEFAVKNGEKEQLEQSSTNHEFKLFSASQKDFMFVKNFNLPGFKQGEILSLVVGSTTNTRHLWAVTNTKATIVANNSPGIFLYVEGLRGQLYQVISAIQPRSLQQLRIKQETFLSYIQDCCQVQILRYRGSQGFEKFAVIHSRKYIKQILTITLSPHQPGKLKHFLILLLENNIKFYEFVTEGLDFGPSSEFPYKALNCS